MPPIPLPKGIVGLDEFAKTKEYLINLIWTKSGLMRVPGLKEFGTGFGVCRGAVEWKANRVAYMVSGTRFISIDKNGATTDLGEIPGTENCFFSEGVKNLVIGIIGGQAFRYNTSDGLVEITDTDFKHSVSADFIDGRHVFIPADGSPAFYSEVDSAGTIEPLSFFDAEELPDLNKAVINISNQLYILGTDSGEIFRTNVDPDRVFTRREGARVDVGYISGLTRFGGTFAFLGRRRGESCKFYVMSSGDAQAISNPAIDQLLCSYLLEELDTCQGFRYEHGGMEIINFTLPRHTLTFSEGNWSYTSSGKTLQNWRVRGICHAYGKYIVGDAQGPKIGTFSADAQEYGEDVATEIKTFVRSNRGSHFKIKSIEADLLTGQTDSEESIGLAVSKDGRTFGDYHDRSLGVTGQYRERVRWKPPGGIGRFESFAGIKVRSTSAAKTSLEFLSFE